MTGGDNRTSKVHAMSESLAGKTVLLIDDSNTIRRSGEIFLSQAGAKVLLAEDGFDGLS